MLKLGRFRGVRGERTKHTQLFRRTLAGFGLTWHQKVHVSTFDGKLELQCTRNGPQNPPFCPGSIQDIFSPYQAQSLHEDKGKTEIQQIRVETKKTSSIWMVGSGNWRVGLACIAFLPFPCPSHLHLGLAHGAYGVRARIAYFNASPKKQKNS